MKNKKFLWVETLKRLLSDPIPFAALFIVGFYVVIVVATSLDWVSVDYASKRGESYMPPGTQFLLGTDLLGRDVLSKVIHGASVAFSVGMVASLIAIPIGAILGALGGFFGGVIDEAVVWLYSTFTSIPQILFLSALSFVLGRGITSIYIAVGLTSWVGICRIIRAEVLKLKSRDYVLAARALGAEDGRVIFRHMFPNVAHLLIIDFSLRFVYAIKSEAILSYLGLGVQGEPSWGIMIADAKEELVRGIWWQLAGATTAMFVIVLAFNLLGDALRDALDPRLSE